MMKEIYLIAGEKTTSYEAFRKRILKLSSMVVKSEKPDKLTLTLTVAPPPLISIIPFKRGKMASISIYQKENTAEVSPILTGAPGFRFACRAEEAIPVSYHTDRPEGAVTPGFCLLTLFQKKPGITREAFLDRWHNSHTPLSLRIHPLWHYSRNVVTDVLVSKDLSWDGIVEEHFRTRADLLNPFRFFGKPAVILQHMAEVYRDIHTFLNYHTIETWLVQEYHVVCVF
ncbi:MAG TPA: EthD domain-containing protein [Bacteroidales bacterium]|nr:EthD domain-containing protein [Bacteroidales bacterium]HPS51625.1 EthD domain-containing protein [Bacteroidales bacterium]